MTALSVMATATAVLAGLLSTPAHAADVDVALVLAADVSLSMDAKELALQRAGYAEAFTSPIVLDAIRRGERKRIAVTYFEWGSADKQVVVAPWTIIDSPEAAEAFSQRVQAAPANSLERTAIGSALLFAGSLMAAAPDAERHVVDISGDGPNNMGASVGVARDALVSRGITINGLPLIADDAARPAGLPATDQYYEECVAGGVGHFVLPAENIAMFAVALKTKLVMEIAGIPQTEPRIMRAAYAPVDCTAFD